MRGYLERYPEGRYPVGGRLIPMSYCRYLRTFVNDGRNAPKGHKRRGMPESEPGMMYKDTKKEIRWMTMAEYNAQGRKIWGEAWNDYPPEECDR